MLDTLKTFKGLPHRCQTVAEINSVLYVNDSKATNVGATLAALKGFGSDADKNLILIAGGQAKDQDFSDLKQSISDYVRLVILMGEDADQISSVLGDSCQQIKADSLQHAVTESHQLANSGDVVLLSPACASFDMFEGFEDRGNCFQKAVVAMAEAQGDRQ